MMYGMVFENLGLVKWPGLPGTVPLGPAGGGACGAPCPMRAAAVGCGVFRAGSGFRGGWGPREGFNCYFSGLFC